MAEVDHNDEEKQKVTFPSKKRIKCLRTKRASSDSEEDKEEEDMSNSKKNNKRPAENNPEENPSKRNRTEEVNVCAICNDSDNEDSFKYLICAHNFHNNCIDHWLEMSSCCPICRTVVQQQSIRHISYESDDTSDESSYESSIDSQEDEGHSLSAFRIEHCYNESPYSGVDTLESFVMAPYFSDMSDSYSDDNGVSELGFSDPSSSDETVLSETDLSSVDTTSDSDTEIFVSATDSDDETVIYDCSLCY